MNSKEALRLSKKLKKESGLNQRRSFIILTCQKCKTEFKIRVNDKSLYTPEVIAKWVCLSCK